MKSGLPDITSPTCERHCAAKNAMHGSFHSRYHDPLYKLYAASLESNVTWLAADFLYVYVYLFYLDSYYTIYGRRFYCLSGTWMPSRLHACGGSGKPSTLGHGQHVQRDTRNFQALQSLFLFHPLGIQGWKGFEVTCHFHRHGANSLRLMQDTQSWYTPRNQTRAIPLWNIDRWTRQPPYNQNKKYGHGFKPWHCTVPWSKSK